MRVILCLFLLFSFQAPAQDTVNQFDDSGRRHGPWKKTFEENPNQVRYEGVFDHGEEVGLFTFYQSGYKKPAATKFFLPNSDIAKVKYFTRKGNVISEGKMRDTTRIGEWKYFHKDSDKLMMVENYENGILHGEKRTYFPNGSLNTRVHFKNGKRDGEYFLYSEKEVVLEHLVYNHGELHGPAKFYNGKGELLTEGNYIDNRHQGTWKYYENGKLKEEKEFPL